MTAMEQVENRPVRGDGDHGKDVSQASTMGALRGGALPVLVAVQGCRPQSLRETSPFGVVVHCN